MPPQLTDYELETAAVRAGRWRTKEKQASKRMENPGMRGPI
jgi:hypothetical protein